MSSSNIYNILNKLNALQPKAAEPKDQVTKPIYESVEARGSIMSGVNRLEKKLSEQFAADKKALDTNPKNAAWDADALAKHKARLSREKKNIGMQRKVSGMDTGLPPAVQESLIDNDSTDIRELLNFNLFRDYQSFKDGDIDPESYGPEEIQAWEKLFSAWGPIAVQLERQINKAAASGAALTPEQNQEINDNWYDGSDAYDDPLRELPGIYSREIPIIRKILRQSARVKEGMAEDAAPVKYGVFRKGGSIGGDNTKPIKTFDSKEEATAFAKERRAGLSKGERGYYRMSYVVKAIKGVAEGWDDMIKAGKARDAETRSGKKSTATGVKHHGKYGTEYQGDADEEDAAAKAADKGPKKRGRPAKGLAKPKPAAGEKKGRGRPKKAADPTYSGAKDLQNYIVGNLPKGKQAKGKVHKIDEGRIQGKLGELIYDLENAEPQYNPVASDDAIGNPNKLEHQIRSYVTHSVKFDRLPYSYKEQLIDAAVEHYLRQWGWSNDVNEELVPPAAPAGQPLPGLGQGASHIDATQAAQFAPGSKVLIGGRMPAVVKSVSGTTATVYDPANPAAPWTIDTSKLQAAPAAAPAAPAMESELNELAKLAGLTVEASKPDYIDLDRDGNKKEPMKQAAQDAEDEQMDENIPVHKPVTPPVTDFSPNDDDQEGDVCPECDGAGCPECYGDEHRDRAHDHARGMERESAIREAEEMINFMRNAGLDTSRAESALAEAYKYGDTDVEEAPEYANSPDEEIQNVDAITRQGNDLNREKKQFAGKPKAGDNPMASESADPLEAMGRRLMQAYESIKVVDEGMVDKVKGMFGKKKDPNAVPNIFDTEPYKSDTKAYLKKSAKQPGGPNNVKNIFDK